MCFTAQGSHGKWEWHNGGTIPPKVLPTSFGNGNTALERAIILS